MKYRKKPIVIEAVQLKWENWNAVCELAFVGKLENGQPEGCYLDKDNKPTEGFSTEGRLGLKIPTLEGLMIAVENDWIIKGVKGEIYPCKPDIFEASYEPAE